MDVFQALNERRTIRQFDPNYTIPKEDLERLVNTALKSPTGRDHQEIDLYVVTNRQKIDEITTNSFNSWDPARRSNWSKRKQNLGVENVVSCDASAIIFLCANERYDPEGSFLKIDAGIITMSIMALAKSLGLDSMCMGALTWGDTKFIEDYLGVNEGSLVMAVGIGKISPNATPLPEKEIKAKAVFIE